MSSPASPAATNDALNPSLHGTARKLFYWISLLVVLLIAARTALDALDIHLLPHRSWAEGISPTVVQVPGGQAIYYQYILVEASAASDKFHLPPEAQASFLGVGAVVNASDPGAKILLRLTTMPEDLVLLAVVWLLRSMVLSMWKTPSNSPTPFIRANVGRLRWIAGLIGILWLYHLVLPAVMDLISAYTVLNSVDRIREYSPWFSLISWAPLGVMVLLLTLAQVFSHGVRLEGDVEGLV